MSMKTFTINGNNYNAKPFDFNLVCDLEDMGISLQEMGKKRMSVIRAYFALCAGMSNANAGREIEQYIIAGGSLEGLSAAMNDEMEKSDFFRALFKTEEEEVAENPGEKKQGKEK